MAEYGSMFLVSGLAAILFFGGWNGPIPIFHMIGWAGSESAVLHYLANLAGCLSFILKAVFGVTVMMWARWTLPRLRIDQVITTCLKYCVPLAAVCFLGALAWQISGVPFLNDADLLRPQDSRLLREAWVLEEDSAPVEPTGDSDVSDRPDPEATGPSAGDHAGTGPAPTQSVDRPGAGDRSLRLVVETGGGVR